jgi:hypothetical protein
MMVETTDVLNEPKEEECRLWRDAEWSVWFDLYVDATVKQQRERVLTAMRDASTSVIEALEAEGGRN